MSFSVNTSLQEGQQAPALRKVPSFWNVSGKLKRKEWIESEKIHSPFGSPLPQSRESFESTKTEQSSHSQSSYSQSAHFWSRKLSNALTPISEIHTTRAARKDSGYGSGDFTPAKPITSLQYSLAQPTASQFSRQPAAQAYSNHKPRSRHVAIVIPSYAQPVIEPLKSGNSIISNFPDFPPPPSLPPLPRSLHTRRNSTASTIKPSTTQKNRTMTANGDDSRPVLHLRDPSTSTFPSYNSNRPSLSHDNSNMSQMNHTGNGVSFSPAPVAGITNRAGTSPSASDLPCTVFRTTGDEPPALLGASTTILGDKLYVFGGRLSSQRKQDFLNDIYELDLINRHWTKLGTHGDVPSPRFYHSVSALGDSRLVCYGGLGPAPSTMDPSHWSTYERGFTVMSDVSIFDVNTQKWTTLPTVNELNGRYAHCAAIIPSTSFSTSSSNTDSSEGNGGAELVIVGGQDNSSEYMNELSVLNLRSRQWTSTTPLQGNWGAYKSIAATLPGTTADQVGQQRARSRPGTSSSSDRPSSQSPLLLYSNYNFVDVRVDLKVGSPDSHLRDISTNGTQLPSGLRFPSCGVLAGYLLISGTVITSDVQEYQLWAMNLKTLNWSRIEADGLYTGSWNKGLLWQNRNTFVVLGNRTGSQAKDYQQRRINCSHICAIELEAYGLYEAQTQRLSPTTVSHLSTTTQNNRGSLDGSLLSAAENLGRSALGLREVADMEILTLGNDRVPVNSGILSRRWGFFFHQLLEESIDAANNILTNGEKRPISLSPSEATTIRPNFSSRLSSNTITQSRAYTKQDRNSQSSYVSIPADSAIGSISDGSSSKHVSLMSINSASGSSTTTTPLQSRLLFLPHTITTTRALVFYLYTGTLPPSTSPLCTTQVLTSLLQVAGTYSISGLLPATVTRLHQTLSADSCGDIFNAAALAAGDGTDISKIAVFKPKPSDTNARLQALASLTSTLPHSQQTQCHQIQHQKPASRSRQINLQTSFGSTNSLDSDATDTSESSTASSSEASDVSDATDDSVATNARRLVGDGDERVVWKGEWSAVIGLQKRGLRGLWEGQAVRREMLAREREREGAGNGGSGLGLS